MFTNENIGRALALACTVVTLAGCMATAPHQHQMPTTSSTTFAPAETMREGRVMEGVVVQTRQVSIQQGPDWTYQAAGAAVGVALGNRLTKNRSNSTRAATAGVLGLIGAKAFDAAGREAEAQVATELIVRTTAGPVVVVQPGPSPQAGDPVYLVGTGQATRVVPMTAMIRRP